MLNKIANALQPKKLSDVIGQPTNQVERIAMEPVASCFMATGPMGVGKTLTSKLLAMELGCSDEWTGLHHRPCADFGIDQCRELFTRTLRLRCCSKSGFRLLILEECEWLSNQVQRYLKDALDPVTNMPKNLIVFGTSNNITSLDPALLDRFRVLEFTCDSKFIDNCRRKMQLTLQILNLPTPSDFMTYGIVGETFSMRNAMKRLEDYISQAT